jgi:hypothetical protein
LRVFFTRTGIHFIRKRASKRHSPVAASLASLIRRLQPIADAGLGQHELRTFRIGFDFLAELADIDAQILRVRQLLRTFAKSASVVVVLD